MSNTKTLDAAPLRITYFNSWLVVQWNEEDAVNTSQKLQDHSVINVSLVMNRKETKRLPGFLLWVGRTTSLYDFVAFRLTAACWWKFTKCAKSSMTYQRACLNFHNKSSSRLISFPRQLHSWLPVVKKTILTPSEHRPTAPISAMNVVKCCS